jgi:hypothetical protein
MHGLQWDYSFSRSPHGDVCQIYVQLILVYDEDDDDDDDDKGINISGNSIRRAARSEINTVTEICGRATVKQSLQFVSNYFRKLSFLAVEELRSLDQSGNDFLASRKPPMETISVTMALHGSLSADAQEALNFTVVRIQLFRWRPRRRVQSLP